MSAPFRYARKMLLVDPDSWERLSTRAGPNGLPPDVTLKRDYQKFLENKIGLKIKRIKSGTNFQTELNLSLLLVLKKAQILNGMQSLKVNSNNKTFKISV